MIAGSAKTAPATDANTIATQIGTTFALIGRASRSGSGKIIYKLLRLPIPYSILGRFLVRLALGFLPQLVGALATTTRAAA
jgi:putative effector of murein hydrolase LrgA (UPF0299 family)